MNKDDLIDGEVYILHNTIGGCLDGCVVKLLQKNPDEKYLPPRHNNQMVLFEVLSDGYIAKRGKQLAIHHRFLYIN